MPAGRTLISLVLGLVFTLCACAYATVMNWKFYASNEFGYYQYDAKDVRRLAGGLVRVRQKLVLSNQGAINLLRELGREYENTKEIKRNRLRRQEKPYTGSDISFWEWPTYQKRIL